MRFREQLCQIGHRFQYDQDCGTQVHAGRACRTFEVSHRQAAYRNKDRAATDLPGNTIGEEESSHLEQMASLLKTLTPREERIINKRFGLEDGSEQSLEEVGNSFGVCSQRIAQIERKALQKLLRIFLEGLIVKT